MNFKIKFELVLIEMYRTNKKNEMCDAINNKKRFRLLVETYGRCLGVFGKKCGKV